MHIGLNNTGLKVQSPPFNPSVLYLASQAGIWRDPSDLASTYKESTGITAGAINSPVGLALDKRLGATTLAGPGNHLLQATSASRPTLSARVNLLTYSEQFDNAAWVKRGTCTITANQLTAPDGTLTADLVSGLGSSGVNDLYFGSVLVASGLRCEPSFYIQKVTATGTLGIQSSNGLANGNWSVNLALLGSGLERITRNHAAVTVTTEFTGSGGVFSGPLLCALAGGPLSFYLWGAQLELGSTATRYQRVTTATDYDTAGFPYFDLMDGTDDGYATAAFAAGTLTADMDCFIAVKRNSAAAGLVATQANASGIYFGYFDTAAGASTANAGSPTNVVDGVALANQTASTLNTALSVGVWHVLEIRNLNLSAWTALQISTYAGLLLNGSIGGIILRPAMTDAQRSQVRRWLAAKVGVTL